MTTILSDIPQAPRHPAAAGQKLGRLRLLKPSLIDLSRREYPTSAPVGQTPADKLAILPKLGDWRQSRISILTPRRPRNDQSSDRYSPGQNR